VGGTRGFLAVSLLMTLALCSCGPSPRARPDVRQVIARCDLEADRVYATAAQDERQKLVGEYADECITAAGYEWDWTRERCNELGTLSRNDGATCYVPLRPLAQNAATASGAAAQARLPPGAPPGFNPNSEYGQAAMGLIQHYGYRFQGGRLVSPRGEVVQ